MLVLAATLVSTPHLSATAPSEYQYEARTGTDNPMASVADGGPFGAYAARACLAAADVDGDGDIDLLVGEYIDHPTQQLSALSYYRNDGSASCPDFVLVPGGGVLAVAVDAVADLLPGGVRPVLADVDSDGDVDLVVSGFVGGTIDQNALYFRNEGGSGSPAYVAVDAAENPFADVESQAGSGGSFAFGDLDGDGLIDLVCASPIARYGPSTYLNTGSPTAPTFGLAAIDPFGDFPLPSDQYEVPAGFALVDHDYDGDLDGVHSYVLDSGYVYVDNLHNVGTVYEPDYNRLAGDNSAFKGLTGIPEVGDLQYLSLVFADLDSDGDSDVLLSGSESIPADPGEISSIVYAENVEPVRVAPHGGSRVSNSYFDSLPVDCNKTRGYIYLVSWSETVESMDDLEAAVAAGRGSRAEVTQAVEPTEISAYGLTAGTYEIWGVDGLGRGAVASTSDVIVTEAGPPVTVGDSSTVWIDAVTFDDETYWTGNNEGYTVVPYSEIPATQGGTLAVSVTLGYSDDLRFPERQLAHQLVGVWLDLNDDADFDDEGEELAMAGPAIGSIPLSLSIPAEVSPGLHRLRIVMQYHLLGAPSPVGPVAYGEVEDYVLSVTEE